MEPTHSKIHLHIIFEFKLTQKALDTLSHKAQGTPIKPAKKGAKGGRGLTPGVYLFSVVSKSSINRL